MQLMGQKDLKGSYGITQARLVKWSKSLPSYSGLNLKNPRQENALFTIHVPVIFFRRAVSEMNEANFANLYVLIAQ